LDSSVFNPPQEDRVSVVIPSYNSSAFLAEALDSVLAQSRPPYEVIVVDDGSTDEIKEVLAPYANRIIVLQQENKGLSVARNNGFARATGDWVALLDADDVWRPDKLARQLDGVAGDASVVCIHSNFYTFGYETEAQTPYAAFLDGRHDVKTLLSGDGWVCPSSALVKRSSRARFYEWAPPAEDVIFFCELTFEGSFRYTPEVLVGHRLHSGQATKQPDAVMAGTMAELKWVREVDAPLAVATEIERIFFASLVRVTTRAKQDGQWRAYWRWRSWLNQHWPSTLPRAHVLDEPVSTYLLYRSTLNVINRIGRRLYRRLCPAPPLSTRNGKGD
jgi:glycosyltransferase involved in cell wall biosynthesis